MKLLRTATAACAALMLLSAGCSQQRVIPDKTLAKIIHDAFLANAYVENRDTRVKMDSVDIYTPIFDRYGYTAEDVRYTIGNFAKRKSARLGDVVEIAIAQLEKEGIVYDRLGTIIDTVTAVGKRAFTSTVLSDSLISISRIKDTASLRLVVDNIREGDYVIDYDYIVDSLDDNISRRSVFFFERADKSLFARQQQNLRKSKNVEHVTRTLRADTSARRLTISLMEFTQPHDAARRKTWHTGVTVTNLRVQRVPLDGEAVDSLYEQQLPLRIFADDFFRIVQRDSSALRPAADGSDE